MMCCVSLKITSCGHGCRSTLSVTRGQYYYEAEVTDEGLCRFGWATSAATLELGQLAGNGH